MENISFIIDVDYQLNKQLELLYFKRNIKEFIKLVNEYKFFYLILYGRIN